MTPFDPFRVTDAWNRLFHPHRLAFFSSIDALQLMVRGYKKGLVKFALIAGTKPYCAQTSIVCPGRFFLLGPSFVYVHAHVPCETVLLIIFWYDGSAVPAPGCYIYHCIDLPRVMYHLQGWLGSIHRIHRAQSICCVDKVFRMRFKWACLWPP